MPRVVSSTSSLQPKSPGQRWTLKPVQAASCRRPGRRRPRPRPGAHRGGADQCSSDARTGHRAGRAVAPEHVLQRLSDLGSSINRPCERRLRVGNIEGQDDRGAADRGAGEHPHLRKLIRYLQDAVADAQLNRHQAPVRYRDPADLRRTERLAVEHGGTLGALNDDVRSDSHWAYIRASHSQS